MECLWIKMLYRDNNLFHVSGRVDSQCSPESGKSPCKHNVKVHENIKLYSCMTVLYTLSIPQKCI